MLYKCNAGEMYPNILPYLDRNISDAQHQRPSPTPDPNRPTLRWRKKLS